MSPSVAQCLRAVFAASMWHEGIVHDAMACASFLKFQPKLAKHDAMTSMRRQRTAATSATQQQHGARVTGRAKNTPRHSRNSSLTSNLSTLSDYSSATDLTKAAKPAPTANANLNLTEPAPRSRDVTTAQSSHTASSYVPEKRQTWSAKTSSNAPDSDMPPTLEHLADFWDEIAQSTLRAASENSILPSPSLTSSNAAAAASATAKNEANQKETREKRDEKKVRRRKEKEQRLVQGMLRRDLLEAPFRERGAPAADGAGDTLCELCGGMFSHPVTYHMRKAHPGCARHAGGQGYNSGGNFCGGWAGNCGDGGVGGSTWYLMCEKCRDRYLKEKKQVVKDKMKKKQKKRVVVVKQKAQAQQVREPHLVMKNNALFLLNLASKAGSEYTTPAQSSAGSGLQAALSSSSGGELWRSRSMRLDSSLPSVNEDLIYDVNMFPTVEFAYLALGGAQSADSVFADDVLLQEGDVTSARSGGLSSGASRRLTKSQMSSPQPQSSLNQLEAVRNHRRRSGNFIP